jgi:hypothetical protein
MKPKSTSERSKNAASRQISGRSNVLRSQPPSGAAYPGVYLAGSASALIITATFLVEMIVVLTKGLPPTTVDGWFSAFQAGRGIGLLRTFVLDIIAVSLHVPLYLALFYLLRQIGERSGLLMIAIAFALIGVAVYLATNTTFSMLSLSDEYAAATTDAQKTQVVAAGKAVLSIYNGTGPFAAFSLYSIAGILVSIVMLKGSIFGKATAVFGIIGNALELGLPPSIDPPLFLAVDPFLIGIGGVFIIVWYVLISLRLIEEVKRSLNNGAALRHKK